jgi:hypothetical protein
LYLRENVSTFLKPSVRASSVIDTLLVASSIAARSIRSRSKCCFGVSPTAEAKSR